MVGKVFAARRKSAPDRRGRATADGELVAIKVGCCTLKPCGESP